MSLLRWVAAWAITRPAAASKKRPRLKPGARTASRPAIAAAVSVIGWTQARVRTNHRERKSFAPAGALHVETAARQAIGGVMTFPARGPPQPRLGAAGVKREPSHHKTAALAARFKPTPNHFYLS